MILTVEIRKAKIQQLSQEIDIFWKELDKYVIQDCQKSSSERFDRLHISDEKIIISAWKGL